MKCIYIYIEFQGNEMEYRGNEDEIKFQENEHEIKFEHED